VLVRALQGVPADRSAGPLTAKLTAKVRATVPARTPAEAPCIHR